MTELLLNREFENIITPLKSYILRITASVHDTEDIVHDTYLKAVDKISSFRGESSIKTWLFSIASNLAKDNLKAQKRWVEDVTDICRLEALKNAQYFEETQQIIANSHQTAFEIKEHITFCFTCITKSLPLEQQLCLLLKDIYEFKISEISTILDCNEPMVKYYLHTARTKMIEIFDGRCALINKEGVCHQCSELNGIFNPKQNFQEELMKIDLAKHADKGDKEHLLSLRMEIVKGIDPFESGAVALQLHHLEYNRVVMEKYV